MPKARKHAPKATVIMQEKDEAFEVIKTYDAKYPAKKHMWKAIEGNDFARLAATMGIEPVEPRVENGMSVLCAMDKAAYEERRRKPAERSREQFKQSVRDPQGGTTDYDKPVSQFRQPKAPLETE